MRAWWIFALCAGCVTTTLHTRPRAIAEHADAFAAGNAAEVAVEEGGTTRLPADRLVQVWVPGDAHVLSRKHCMKVPWIHVSACRGHDDIQSDADTARQVTVRELVSACPGGECLAHAVRDEPIEVGSRSHVSGAAVASFLGAGIMFGAGAYCVAQCDGKTAAAGAFSIGILLLLAPLAALR